MSSDRLTTYLSFIHWTMTSSWVVPLIPIVGQWFAIQRQGDVVGNQIASGQEYSPPVQPAHAKDAAIECQDGILDDADAPRIDVDVGECNLLFNKH